jgi:hypothetical protein
VRIGLKSINKIENNRIPKECPERQN